MSVALRTITRLQDADDINVTLGVGVDEYALCWDNDTAKFVLRAMSAGVTDHGALTGLADDDHTQYALLAGRAGGQTLTGGTAAGDVLTLKGTSGNGASQNAIVFKVGNNGDISALRIGNSGAVGIGVDAHYAFPLYVKWQNTTAYRYGVTISDVGTPTHANANFPLQITSSSGTQYFSVSKSGDVYMAGGCTIGGGSLSVTGYNPLGLVSSYSYGGAPGVHLAYSFGRNDPAGTPANGAGCGFNLKLKTSTTNDVQAASIEWSWNDVTHATRKADLVLTARDSGGAREGLRIRGDGSGPAVGFYGVAPIARAVLATGAGATVDNVITALQNLGLVKQS